MVALSLPSVGIGRMRVYRGEDAGRPAGAGC